MFTHPSQGASGGPRPCPRGHGQAQWAFPGPHGLLWLRDVRDQWESTKALIWGQDWGLGYGSDWKGLEAALEENRLSWAAGLKGGSLWSSPGVCFYLLRLHQVVALQACGQVGWGVDCSAPRSAHRPGQARLTVSRAPGVQFPRCGGVCGPVSEKWNGRATWGWWVWAGGPAGGGQLPGWGASCVCCVWPWREGGREGAGWTPHPRGGPNPGVCSGLQPGSGFSVCSCQSSLLV